MMPHLPKNTLFWIAASIIAWAGPAGAQPRPDDPLATYEVQIDGESFRVEGNQRPVKVTSKKGASYNLAVRVAMTQILRLNSIRMEYGMWSRVVDDKGKDIRFVQILNDLAFSLQVTDLGHALNESQQDKLLETFVTDTGKKYREQKATDLKKVGPVMRTFGVSSGKGTKITYKDEGGVAHTTMVFVLSGDGYTVGVVAEFRDHDFEDAMPWINAALNSIRPLH
jgi:hypothetical protein